MIISTRTNSRGWHCSVPGCKGCGSGYGSERAAANAERRHAERSHLHHRPAQTGVEQ